MLANNKQFTMGVPAAGKHFTLLVLKASTDQNQFLDPLPGLTYPAVPLAHDISHVIICQDGHNEPDAGRIIVDKVTNPPQDPQLFDFSASWTTPFQLADLSTPHDSGPLAPGSYSVSEAPLAGWVLTSASCDDGSPIDAIDLAAGETVTCTFTNTRKFDEPDLGRIIVEKQTLPDKAAATFDFTGDVVGTIGDGGQIIVKDLVPGTYTSTETVLAGWDLTRIVCDDANSSGDTTTATATFNLEAGETVTCTFTNAKQSGGGKSGGSSGGGSSGGGQPPTDMLVPTDILPVTSGLLGGTLAWTIWVLLSAALIVTTGSVIRRQRLAEIEI